MISPAVKDFEQYGMSREVVCSTDDIYKKCQKFLNKFGYRYSEEELEEWMTNWFDRRIIQNYIKLRKKEKLLELWIEE